MEELKYEYDDLSSSFSAEEPLFGGDSSIDRLCQTYLSSMDTFPDSSSYSSDYPSSYSTWDYTVTDYSSYSSEDCYTNLSSSTDYNSLSPDYNNSLLEEMKGFSRQDISEWREEDCVDWAASVCRQRSLEQSAVRPFRSTRGAQLLHMCVQNFCDLVGPIYGPIFHQELQDLRKQRAQGLNAYRQAGASPYSDYGDLESSLDLNESLDLTRQDLQDLDRYIPHEADWNPILGSLQDMDLEGAVPIHYESVPETLTPESVAELSNQASPLSPAPAIDPLQKIQPDPKKRIRGPKNWEFVIRLLADPSTNPSLIRWEDQSQAKFRLVQPGTIASMWGKRSNKPNLSYDNFARGLRYHYTTGALEPVSEKQLVYRCGPKAIKYLIELKKGQLE